ncbi:pleiotrophic regulatory protein DegT [Candidatus Moduliflexus flocculans]|uniref:Pleiotrophic regulatory protein DegT n=1 Tax=Candidatus Moduliflexus flocculans TaxID=1499966 RepID=A0A081BS90_9BACT|nr:pleiotrophic regulatory protein DegT [Candidatus Moduliflexus flocculans]
MRVPLLDLQAQYATIRDEIRPVVERVIESQQFILGAEVAAFEQEIAAYCGAKYAIGVSSGTDALLLALMAAGIGEGDEVITTPYSFIATATAISRVGAIPVFVDIDPVTYNIDPAMIEDEITNSTKAIIPVHLFGQCANMKPILDLAKQYKILVIEDAAQAIGAEYAGLGGKKPMKAGTMGDFGCFSFFPSKNLGGFGDGGLVTTNDEALATRVKQLRQHGGADKYRNTMIGINGRLDALQAAVLRVKLKHLDSWSAARREHADYYTKAFQKVAGVQTPATASGNVPIYNQYVLRAEKRDELQAALNQQEIGNAIYYPIPLHLQECYRELKYQEGDFPAAEQAAKEAIALPVYPELTQAQQDYVIETIQAFYR